MITAATTTTMGIKAEAEYAREKTSVWWDIENCEVPRGWDAHAIAQNVSTALLKMGYCGPVSISAYGDTNLIPHDVQQALSSTGVGLNHVPAGVKDASDKKILVDMCLWAADNPAPANFMLISGDRDFSYALHQLRMRRYNILLAQPPHASAPLVAAAKNVWLWTSLASGGLPLTSGESSRLLNNGRSNVSNSEKHPVSEQAQSSKPNDSTSYTGDTKDLKTRETHSPGGLLQEARIYMPSSCRGGTIESFNAHLQDKRHISQAAFLASQKVQANVSAKPIQAKVFSIACTNKNTYAKQQNNLKQQSGKSKTMSREPVHSLKEVMEKQKKTKNADYACRLCNVACQSQVDINSHLRGQRHATMRKQSEALTDFKKLQDNGVGQKYQPKEKTAEHQFQSQNAQKNSKCSEKHIVMVNQPEALVDSKKFQKKVVWEVKDQPRKKTAEPQLQSQKILENSKCFEKHVAMVNQLEVPINSRKHEDKEVQEKAQPIETILEPQSLSQNTQEHTKLFEKQNGELREKCGSSESIVKEPFKSSENRVETVNKQLTNGEFLRCVFEVPKEASIAKPINRSQGAADHSGEVKKKEAAFVATNDAQSSVSTKPMKEPEDCLVFCQLCQVISSSKVDHNNGEKHRQNLELQSAKNEIMSTNDAQSSVSTKPMKEPEDCLVFCQLCQVISSSKVDHNNGEKHRQNLELQSAKNEIMSKEPAHKENAKKEKKVLCKNQTASDSHLKSQNHAAVVKEQAEETVSWKNQVNGEKETVKAEGHAHEKVDVLGCQGAQGYNEKLKERCAISERSKRAFTVLKREPLLHKESRHPLNMIPERVELPRDCNLTKKSQNETVFDSCLTNQNHATKTMVKEENKELKNGCTTSESIAFTESRGCLDIIPERVQVAPVVSVIEKLEDKSMHKPVNETAGRKEHPGGEAARKEEVKDQVDNFWTRLFGKRS